MPEFAGKGGAYKIRESIGAVELITGKLVARVDKKTGSLTFASPDGKGLLTERIKEPRQAEKGRVWEYFDWKKDEVLLARGERPGEVLQIGSMAKYISFGPASRVLPGIASSKGYEIFFPPKLKTLCCNIPMYGSYISQEGTDLIDFYFVSR